MFTKKTLPDLQKVYHWCLLRAKTSFPSRFTAPSQNEAERIARFEAIALYCAMVTWRCESAGDLMTRDAFLQHVFSDFDAALREQGVSDIKVGKEVRKLASALYGRCTAYTPAFEAQNREVLLAAMVRNKVLQSMDSAEQIAETILEDAKALAAHKDDDWVQTLAA